MAPQRPRESNDCLSRRSFNEDGRRYERARKKPLFTPTCRVEAFGEDGYTDTGDKGGQTSFSYYFALFNSGNVRSDPMFPGIL